MPHPIGCDCPRCDPDAAEERRESLDDDSREDGGLDDPWPIRRGWQRDAHEPKE